MTRNEVERLLSGCGKPETSTYNNGRSAADNGIELKWKHNRVYAHFDFLSNKLEGETVT